MHFSAQAHPQPYVPEAPTSLGRAVLCIFLLKASRLSFRILLLVLGCQTVIIGPTPPARVTRSSPGTQDPKNMSTCELGRLCWI